LVSKLLKSEFLILSFFVELL